MKLFIYIMGIVAIASAAGVPGSDPRCPAIDGALPVYFRDPNNCAAFYECSNGTPYHFDCPTGTLFDTTLNVCNWPDKVNCGGPGPTVPPKPTSPTAPTKPSPGPTHPTAGPTPSNKCPAVPGPTPVYFRDDTYCNVFYECSNGTPYRFVCPADLVFDTTKNVCNWPSEVNCGGSGTTVPPKPTSPTAPTKPSPGPTKPTAGPTPSNICPAVSGKYPVYFRDPQYCNVFYECSNGTPYRFECPAGLVFDTTLDVCNWPSQVNCGDSSTTKGPITTARPNPTTAGPNPTTARPNPTTAGPNPTTPRPNPTTARPNPTTPRPNPTTPDSNSSESSDSSDSDECCCCKHHHHHHHCG